jgi:hypothetical protein
MAIPRRAQRRDANEAFIIKTLRSIPHVTVMTSETVDLIVGFRGNNYLIEIKDPDKTMKKNGEWKSGAIKDSQVKLLQTWTGNYHIVTEINEILEIIGVA